MNKGVLYGWYRGVLRGGEQALDISADLQGLARINVAVFSAGAKSILDIGLTLEYVETMGVPEVGLRTSEFPAFFCRESGYGVDVRYDSEAEVTQMIKTQ